MPRSLKVLLTLSLITLGLTAGCGSRAGNTHTTITYWANPEAATPAQHEKVLRPVLDEFTRKTGISVKLEMQDWTKVYPKIIAGAASGTLPDVFDTGSTWAAALQATGGLLQFDDRAFKAIGGRSKFVATSMSSTGAAGKDPAAIPLYGLSYGLFYNPKLFAAAGISSPPRTWDEYVADAKQLTKPGQWGVALPGNGPLFNVHQAFILGRQDGSHLFDSQGKPDFDTAPERAAVRRMLDLMAVDHVIDPSMVEKNGLDAITAFAQGHTGMLINQDAVVGVLASLGFSDYSVAPVPTVDPVPAGGAAIQSMVAGTNLAVAKNTRHRAAALKLIAFLTSDRAQTTLNKAFGTLPVINGLQGSPAFSSPRTATFATILAKHSETMPMVPDEGAMESVLGVALVKLWPKAADGSLTDKDISTALRNATEQMPHH